MDKIRNLVDVLVHIEPARFGTLGDWAQIHYDLRQIADGMGVGVHDLRVNTEENGEYLIEVHLEMAGDLSLGEAHGLAEEFEGKVANEWPQTGRVITHLEPLPDTVQGARTIREGEIVEEFKQAIKELITEGRVLEVNLSSIGGVGSIAARVCFPSTFSLEEAHTQAEYIERQMLIQFPQVHRVIVHVEPEISD